MSEKRYSSNYGKSSSETGLSMFGTTVSDGVSSINSGRPNLLQTTIIPKGLGQENADVNSIQSSRIISQNNKIGLLGDGINGSTYYATTALLQNDTLDIILDYDFTSLNTDKIFKISSEILIILKIDNSISGHANIAHSALYKYNACVAGLTTGLNAVDPVTSNGHPTILFSSWTIVGKSSGYESYILEPNTSETGGIRSLINTDTNKLTFTLTAQNTIDYSVDMLSDTEIISTDINNAILV